MDARDLISEVVHRPASSIDADSALESVPGVDSIVMVRLMLRLEEVMGRELDQSEMENIATVRDVQQLLGKRRS